MDFNSDTNGEWVVNKDCGVFTSNDTTVVANIYCPHSRRQMQIVDPILLHLLHFLSTPRSAQSICSFLADRGMPLTSALELVGELIDARVIIDQCGRNGEQNKHDDIWRKFNWGEALFFNQSCQDESYLDEVDPKNEVRRRTLGDYISAKSIPNGGLDSGSRAEIILPEAESTGSRPLWDLLSERRTTRQFAGSAIPLSVLARVLRSGSQVQRRILNEIAAMAEEEPTVVLRSLFTALDLFVVAQRVSDLPVATYEYDCSRHSLVKVRPFGHVDEADQALKTVIWGQGMASAACFSIFLVVNFERYMWQYRYPRAYRNILISAGELGQLLLVVGQSEGLKSCMTPAIRDSFTDELLSVNSDVRQCFYYLGFGL